MAVNQDLKRAIDEIKRLRGLSQSEIADILGVKANYLSDMINGRVPLSKKITDKIYDYFHIGVLDDFSKEISKPTQLELDFTTLLESNSKMARAVDTIAESNKIMALSNAKLTDNNTKLIEQLLDTLKQIDKKLDKGGGVEAVKNVVPGAAQG